MFADAHISSLGYLCFNTSLNISRARKNASTWISARLFGYLSSSIDIFCFCSPKRTHFNLIRVESYRSNKVNRMALLRMASLIPLNIRHKAKTLCYSPKAKTLLTDSCLYRSINLYIVKPNPDISSNFTNSARNYQDLKHFRWIKINLSNQKGTSNNSMMRNISNLRKMQILLL